MEKDDTVCAISTPVGEGGIGIVRMSGPLAHPILKKIFKPKKIIIFINNVSCISGILQIRTTIK